MRKLIGSLVLVLGCFAANGVFACDEEGPNDIAQVQENECSPDQNSHGNGCGCGKGRKPK